MISCGEAAAFYRLSAGRVPEVVGGVIVKVIDSAATLARSYIGNYQEGWDALSGGTIEGFRHHNGAWIPGKIELGYSPPDNPLMRDGTLKASIDAELIGPTEGMIGSAELTALWQELGTEGAEYPIPPRPFLAKAIQEVIPEAELLLEEAAVILLLPGE